MTARQELRQFIDTNIAAQKMRLATPEEFERLRTGAADVPDLNDPQRKVGTICTFEGLNILIPTELHEQFMALRSKIQQEESTE